jgi:hypothetical protein
VHFTRSAVAMEKRALKRVLLGQHLRYRKVLNISAAVTSHVTLRSAVLESKASLKPGDI